MRGGAIVDMEAAESSILTAVHAAEQMAGETIRDVVVNISGGHPDSRTVGVEVSIAGHEVGDGDLRRVLDHGRALRAAAATAELIHSIPVGYSIDGSRGIRDPRGMFGERLGVDMHIVTADAGAVRNLTTCVARCHLDIEALVVSPYAAGLAAWSRTRWISASPSSTWAAAPPPSPCSSTATSVYTDIVPIGGAHVTNDIARGLSTPLAHAERMKTLYGSAIASPADEREMIDVPQVGEEDRDHANHVPQIDPGRHHPAAPGGDLRAGARAARSRRLRQDRRPPRRADRRRQPACRACASWPRCVLDKQVRHGPADPHRRPGRGDRRSGLRHLRRPAGLRGEQACRSADERLGAAHAQARINRPACSAAILPVSATGSKRISSATGYRRDLASSSGRRCRSASGAATYRWPAALEIRTGTAAA